MRTSEIIAKLKTMATKAGETLYERAKLAAQVLADKAWLDAEFCGDHDKALKFVEVDCFPELSQAIGLNELLTLLKEFPEQSEWKEHKYNLVRLTAAYEERHAVKRKERSEPRKTATVADLEQRDGKIKELEWRVNQSRETNETLEQEVKRLRQENAELRGEVRALNKVIEQMRQGQRQLVA